jgi:Peptidase family M1 domain
MGQDVHTVNKHAGDRLEIIAVPIRALAAFALFAVILAPLSVTLNAQHPANANPYYQQLRSLLPGGEAIQISNLELHRDAATFTFRSGIFEFYGEVNGKVTGAVFKGDGHLHIAPPTAEERHNLSVVMHSEEFDEDFDQVVLRFTDATAAELHKASSGKSEASAPCIRAAQEFQTFARLKLHQNYDLRLLQDVLSPSPGGYFMAAIHGKKYAHLSFIFDPQGADSVSPEEVELMNWNDWGESIPLAFHRAAEYRNGAANGNEANAPYRILTESLDVFIEKNGYLAGVATVAVQAQQDGVAVVPLDLYPTLRVTLAETAKGEVLDYVQEKKEDDPDFGVVLAKALNKGESQTLRITYGGKDVVMNEGGANYYPVARESWYPNASSGLGNYATYRMLFHVPKGLELLATGTKVSESGDGKVTTTEWKTDVPLAVVGFNLGKFTMKEAKVEGKLGDNLTIDAYANTTPPDDFAQMAGGVLGSLSTTSMLPVQLNQGEVAARLYTNYFGPLPFARVQLTQQFACNYGQSWPMLVYLPICGFLDSTQQHFMGLKPENMYWKVVTPHEVAHQWWGQTVGFKSYRDQWMSEGFANTSASIFLQATRPKPDDFREFWKQQRKLITEKNAQGFRPIDVGPVTMGFRLSTEKTGWDIYQDLVYPKGAYILHMIRMMMWTPKEGDGRFIDTMHDFLATYRLQAATTEDFKAVVEKHMSPQMNLDANGRMDWFFNQYVYGTDLPIYHFESQVTQNGDTSSLHIKLTQSGVPANFKMMVPIYLETVDGKVLRLGSVMLVGSMTADRTVQLPKSQAPVKRALINYFYDVLSTEN